MLACLRSLLEALITTAHLRRPAPPTRMQQHQQLSGRMPGGPAARQHHPPDSSPGKNLRQSVLASHATSHLQLVGLLGLQASACSGSCSPACSLPLPCTARRTLSRPSSKQCVHLLVGARFISTPVQTTTASCSRARSAAAARACCCRRPRVCCGMDRCGSHTRHAGLAGVREGCDQGQRLLTHAL